MDSDETQGNPRNNIELAYSLLINRLQVDQPNQANIMDNDFDFTINQINDDNQNQLPRWYGLVNHEGLVQPSSSRSIVGGSSVRGRGFAPGSTNQIYLNSLRNLSLYSANYYVGPRMSANRIEMFGNETNRGRTYKVFNGSFAGSPVKVKVTPMTPIYGQQTNWQQNSIYVRKDIEMMVKLGISDRFVRLVGSELSVSDYFIAVDVMKESCADYVNRIKQGQSMEQYDISIIFKELFKGLQYMHEHRLVHCDIRLKNIYLCETSGELSFLNLFFCFPQTSLWLLSSFSQASLYPIYINFHQHFTCFLPLGSWKVKIGGLKKTKTYDELESNGSASSEASLSSIDAVLPFANYGYHSDLYQAAIAMYSFVKKEHIQVHNKAFEPEWPPLRTLSYRQVQLKHIIKVILANCQSISIVAIVEHPFFKDIHFLVVFEDRMHTFLDKNNDLHSHIEADRSMVWDKHSHPQYCSYYTSSWKWHVGEVKRKACGVHSGYSFVGLWKSRRNRRHHRDEDDDPTQHAFGALQKDNFENWENIFPCFSLYLFLKMVSFTPKAHQCILYKTHEFKKSYYFPANESFYKACAAMSFMEGRDFTPQEAPEGSEDTDEDRSWNM